MVEFTTGFVIGNAILTFLLVSEKILEHLTKSECTVSMFNNTTRTRTRTDNSRSTTNHRRRNST